jgi:succinate-semialdehyde dehydrogenase/glutarate-semialdehyde dehydrogenase
MHHDRPTKETIMSTPASHTSYKTVNPANGKLVRAFAEMTDADLAAVLEAAQHAYETRWQHETVAHRAAVVARAAAAMRERAEEFAQIATLEMGKLIDESRYEVRLSADILDYYARHAEQFLRPQPLPDATGSVVATAPIGIVLAVEPWNFPYYQLARVAGPQLVAGNVVLMKHAPNVPQCALAFAGLFEEAGAPAGVYTNLFCSVEQVSALIDDFRVRAVTLTGSERAGAAVAERAGRALKKAVLELGGSDPFIVLEDAPFDAALDAAYAGRMANMGQACIASKRIIVVGRERGQRFIEGLKQRMGAISAGDPADPATRLGPINSERALLGLLDQVERAKAAGARVVLGGRRIDRAGWYMEPTIVTDIAEDNPLYQEETFGPVASVYVVDSEAEALRIANATKFGLGAVVFGSDDVGTQRVAGQLDCGMVFINSAPYTAPNVPFGGVKNSGYGRELAELGIGEFVNRKLVRTAKAA